MRHQTSMTQLYTSHGVMWQWTNGHTVPLHGEGPLETVEVRPIWEGSRHNRGADRHTHLPSGGIGDIRRATPGPGRTLLHHSAGVPVTKSWLVQQIRAVLSSLGLPQDEYAGHSFRISAATSAALAGVEDSTIQTLGRWQSAAFLQYICMPREQLAAISRRLALAGMTPPAPLGGTHTRTIILDCSSIQMPSRHH